MKKQYILICAFLILVWLTGCDKAPQSSSASTDSPSADSASVSAASPAEGEEEIPPLFQRDFFCVGEGNTLFENARLGWWYCESRAGGCKDDWLVLQRFSNKQDFMDQCTQYFSAAFIKENIEPLFEKGESQRLTERFGKLFYKVPEENQIIIPLSDDITYERPEPGRAVCICPYLDPYLYTPLGENRTITMIYENGMWLIDQIEGGKTPEISEDPSLAPPFESVPAFDPSAEPPLSDWDRQIPALEFLTEEQKELYWKAYKIYPCFIGVGSFDYNTCFPFEPVEDDFSFSDTISLDDHNYHLLSGRYHNWDDFTTMMHSVFTDELVEELYMSRNDGCPMFREINGATGYLYGERGSDPRYDSTRNPVSFELVSESGAAIDITVTVEYTTEEHVSVLLDGSRYQAIKEGVTYESYPIRYEKTSAGWRIAQFGFPY